MNHKKFVDGFVDGFAVGTNLTREKAEEQWAAFSSGMVRWQVAEIEAGGWSAGLREGAEFKASFPEDVEKTAY